MSKIYSGQLLTLQLETLTDLKIGSPSLNIEITKDDGATIISKPATIVPGGTDTVMQCLLSASDTTTGVNTVVTVKAQAIVTQGASAPWRGETSSFKIYPLWG